MWPRPSFLTWNDVVCALCPSLREKTPLQYSPPTLARYCSSFFPPASFLVGNPSQPQWFCTLQPIAVSSVVRADGVYWSMTSPRPLPPTERFASCNSGEAQSRRRSPGGSTGGRRLSTREMSIQPGMGPVPGAAEHHIEHGEGHVFLLEMPVLQIVVLFSSFCSFPTC